MEKPALYIIATPIGNLEDMTLRALRILKEEVDVVFCEDTRQTKKLLNHYGIDVPAYSLHAHSAEHSLNHAVALIEQGKTLAYMTDCGTPGVSDPGSRLVEAVRGKGFTVSPLPGPSALAAISSVSGFSGKHIHFAGFLSKKEGRRRNELKALVTVEGVIVVYESPHRIHKTLLSIAAVFPGKPILIGREMTKMFEEFIAGNTTDIAGKLETVKEKGEFAIAIDNSDPEKADDGREEDDEE
jgi:16S rRNA (cytidine1402-2'-O)-methyltransferase